MAILQSGNMILNNKYRIDALIGEGAFAQVYRAMHLQLQAPRALKILRHDAPGVGSTEFADYAQRFQLEAQLGAKLNNQPHVIQVHDFERDGEMLILVMEYASGGSLADRIDQARQMGQPIPIDDVIKIALEVADGLAAIHALDVVHRDLKPSNILFDAQGRAKIADLGLAQVPGGPSMRSRLSQGVPHPGTPAYMSPEQLHSFEHLAPAADVYALGAVLFEVLTSRLLRSIKPGTHAQSLRADMPEWLDELLIKMLAKDVDGRPWDGAEVVEAARAAQEAARRAAEQARLAKLEQERLEAEERARKELILTLAPGVTMEFVRIPASDFLMGSTNSLSINEGEKPPHHVYLDEYLIGKYPVTEAQFDAFLKASKYQWNRQADLGAKPNHPVAQASYRDAIEFCIWAAKQTGKNIRLPSEAEWEKAARGSDEREYPWGDQAPTEQLCNFNGNVKDTTPVGQYSPQGDSPYGCADMAGNVWEWVDDWYRYDYYAQSPAKNPAGPTYGPDRVLRGGGWGCGAVAVRTAYRFRVDPELLSDLGGFRCASGEPLNSAERRDEAAVTDSSEVIEQPQRELTLMLAPDVTMEFVGVPAGAFLMGSTDQQAKHKDEKPQHAVYLDTYFICKYPVTLAQFAAFVKTTDYRTTAEDKGTGHAWTGKWEEIKGANWQHPCGSQSSVSQKENHPVTQVSWHDAVAFCEWATKQTGMKVRLPTEAEWEKAAHGHSTDSGDARMYPWGNAEPAEHLCNFNLNVKDTTPVGEYSPQGDSPYECTDMSGNVWEWSADWFDENYYTLSPFKNPTGPVKGQYRVLRGGSWYNEANNVRASSRYKNYPVTRINIIGFRCACDVSKEQNRPWLFNPTI